MNTDKSPDTMGAAPTLEEPLASTSVGGRKSIEAAAEEAPAVVLIDDDDSSYLSEDDDEYSDSEYDDSDDEDEEEDEAWLERLRILEDARQLKKVAAFFLHPEKPVKTESTASARCFFERASAPERTSAEEEAEYIQVQKEAENLKKLAADFAHPEHSVEAEDPTAFARCYFDRASAEEQVSCEEADERARLLEDAEMLKEAAYHYLHPEEPVKCTDATVFGCNYFARASALEQESMEEAQERARILVETQSLKKHAVDYRHPEVPVRTTDPAAGGRNYFNRPSAPEAEDVEDAEERARILEEAALLKKSAVDYLHPEIPVQSVDGLAFGRNYFNRASAPETEDAEDVEERARILKEAALFKKNAVDYLHPEDPIKSNDGTAFGRNYFNRPSASETEDIQDAKERARILEEAALLKKSAVDYLHPEVPVQSVDGSAFGRNYFNRLSAPETEDIEAAEEKARILEESKLLEKSAVDYLHPEVPVHATDGTAFGRNYFNRSSAPETDDMEDLEERARILEEAALLKKSAVDYLHPEVTVQCTDGTVFGRNYFYRASAPETEDMEDVEERARIMEESKLLKKGAVAYLHPEAPVHCTDGTAFGRNYFKRSSGPEMEDMEDVEERARILEEAALLKKSAVDYLHPEVTVQCSDGTVFGRNYFYRASGPETEDMEDVEERARILEEAALLKKSAVTYLHPEAPVHCTDGTAFGRNYFKRSSGPETEDMEDVEERARILEEAALLKKSAVDYLHPEATVQCTDGTAFGRNYFKRSSGPETEDMEDVEERARIMEEAALLKKSAVAYLHPEAPVRTTDPAACGRNYFCRASAPGIDEFINSTVERKRDAAVEKEQVFKSVGKVLFPKGKQAIQKISSRDNRNEEGGLPRSPSAVMLFNSGGAEEAF